MHDIISSLSKSRRHRASCPEVVFLPRIPWRRCGIPPNFRRTPFKVAVCTRGYLSSGLTQKPEKCGFVYKELKFLGHVANSARVLPDPAKTLAIANFSRLKDKKGVRKFLGLLGCFVGKFAQSRCHSRASQKIAPKRNQLASCNNACKARQCSLISAKTPKRKCIRTPVIETWVPSSSKSKAVVKK